MEPVSLENKTIARKFRLLSQLMELYDTNPFKIKAIANAAFKLDKLPFRIVERSEKELSEEQGIGKSIASKVWEFVQTGSILELDEYLGKTPEGILEMLQIKGLGPKKIKIIWNDLAIETLGELYYACNENRLIEAKGFGLKTQEEIKNAIEFNMANEGFFIFAHAEKIANDLYAQLKQSLPAASISFTGDFRRKAEILNVIEILTDAPLQDLVSALTMLKSLNLFEQQDPKIEAVHESGLAFRIIRTTPNLFPRDLLLSTGSESHLQQLISYFEGSIPEASSEEAIYALAQLDYIEPELREGLDEIEKAAQHRLPKLVTYSDIKGTLHNHSTYSDGVHSLREMALYCKNELHLEYLGICDHSKTAVYAKGLKEERVYEQWREIEQLNLELAPFRIFKGIESDILGDGSLDYPEEILKGFDFIVASIHANLKMDMEKATQRLIKAIENPYTTLLGHPTGRLLLSRAGYPIDHKKVIDACAANQVAIEINANPLRLDLDWRWHRYALQQGVLLAINPDAHRVEGFHDMHYGTLIARKGGLEASQCLNCFSLEQITSYFKQRKDKTAHSLS